MADIDRNGTCRIRYGFPYTADSSFSKPRNMAAVRRLELHFHMTKNNAKEIKVVNFTEGPLGHWMVRPRGSPHPPLTIILTVEGEVLQLYQHSVAIRALHDLTRVLGKNWSGIVIVDLQYGLSGKKFGNSVERRNLIGLVLEDHLGPATVIPGFLEHRFKFTPGQNSENFVPGRRSRELEECFGQS